MCLFPKLIKNRRYTPNKKNGGVPPVCDDYRKLLVPVGCGKCIECMRQKALQWKIRLYEELKVQTFAYYVTFTFSPESLQNLMQESELKECNAIAGIAIRRYLERWRKFYKKSQKHWLITELGHNNTERIHLHGIVFSDFEITKDTFEKFWKYGNVEIGEYCNLQTINYIAKYITKIDTDHKNYVPQIFCSAGIGKHYTERPIVKQIHTWRDTNTTEFYRFPNGTKCNLPIYYRNKLFTEDMREQLWVNKLDQNKRYVLGVEINDIHTIKGDERYQRVLRKAQEKNIELGFGDSTKEWQKKEYNITRRMLQKGIIRDDCSCTAQSSE